jgi:hypothetical protein
VSPGLRSPGARSGVSPGQILLPLADQTFRNLQRAPLALTHPTPLYRHLLTTAGEREMSRGESQGQVDGVGPASPVRGPLRSMSKLDSLERPIWAPSIFGGLVLLPWWNHRFSTYSPRSPPQPVTWLSCFDLSATLLLLVVSYLCDPTNGYQRGAHRDIDSLRDQLIPFAQQCQERGRPDILIQEDGAPAHVHSYQRSVYRKYRVKRLVWPGNSPDLNAIEPCWP